MLGALAKISDRALELDKLPDARVSSCDHLNEPFQRFGVKAALTKPLQRWSRSRDGGVLLLRAEVAETARLLVKELMEDLPEFDEQWTTPLRSVPNPVLIRDKGHYRPCQTG